VIRLSESRQNLMDVAANAKSAQMVIKGADHYYKENGTAQVLTNTIDTWLSGLR
jgi:hypothetical protein